MTETTYSIDFKYTAPENQNYIEVFTYLCHPMGDPCEYSIDTLLDHFSDILQDFMSEYDMGRMEKNDTVNLDLSPCFYKGLPANTENLKNLFRTLHETNRLNEFVSKFKTIQISYMHTDEKEFVEELIQYFGNGHTIPIDFCIEPCFVDKVYGDHEYIRRNYNELSSHVELFKERIKTSRGE